MRRTIEKGETMMQAFKTAILVGGLAALAGCASWDNGPICTKTHGWQAWADSRCDAEVAPQAVGLQAGTGDKDKLAADLAENKQRNAELERQLADRDKELAGLRGELSTEMAKLKEAQRRLIPALRPEIEKGDITVDLNNERLLINLSSAYLFGSGQDELKPAGADALKHVGAVLKDFPEYKVSVDGHTDNVPIQGALQKRFPTNKELSQSRAANAAKALTKGGLRTVMTHGYADTRPVESNMTASGRAKNRRVEVRVTK
jgi:chemotaxis protein MotB